MQCAESWGSGTAETGHPISAGDSTALGVGTVPEALPATQEAGTRVPPGVPFRYARGQAAHCRGPTLADPRELSFEAPGSTNSVKQAKYRACSAAPTPAHHSAVPKIATRTAAGGVGK